MREFLKNLELEKEIVDKIMVEYGKHMTAEQEKKASMESEIATYKTEINGYKTQIDGLNKTIEDNNKSLENLQNITNENKDLKAEIQMSGSKVKSEFSKFVKNEVMSQVNDETDFNTALENYKKENPQYFGDTVVKKVQTSPSLNTGGSQPHSTNEIMNDILRGALNN